MITLVFKKQDLSLHEPRKKKETRSWLLCSKWRQKLLAGLNFLLEGLRYWKNTTFHFCLWKEIMCLVCFALLCFYVKGSSLLFGCLLFLRLLPWPGEPVMDVLQESCFGESCHCCHLGPPVIFFLPCQVLSHLSWQSALSSLGLATWVMMAGQPWVCSLVASCRTSPRHKSCEGAWHRKVLRLPPGCARSMTPYLERGGQGPRPKSCHTG